ncbi:hypothetical protein P7K49_012189 [Saguinus oedipus]|uniref:Uncharacterized protein n=1 Tax=Saguinus oedipus TaxID=9490 RepID=A0ABQ9VST8_SAGOE|nr:hypothetical protein P7K49_012189 [Saguinus oedipus]
MWVILPKQPDPHTGTEDPLSSDPSGQEKRRKLWGDCPHPVSPTSAQWGLAHPRVGSLWGLFLVSPRYLVNLDPARTCPCTTSGSSGGHGHLPPRQASSTHLQPTWDV